MARQTWHDVIKPGQRVQKSQEDEGRYYIPDALVGRPSDGPFHKLVWNGVRRKLAERQRPARRGERVLSRKPTFTDFIVNLGRGLETRQADAYDAATESDYSEDLAELLDGLDSLAESEKSASDEWIGWPTHIQKTAESARPTWKEMVSPGYIEKVLGRQ